MTTKSDSPTTKSGYAIGDAVSVLLDWDIHYGVIVSEMRQGAYLVRLNSGREVYFTVEKIKPGGVVFARMLV